MASYNRILILGNLTRDPEYKQLSSGQAVCRLGVASNRQYRNKQSGDMVQEVCFVDVDVWGAQADSCRQFLQKGSQVLVEGRLKFDTWEDSNGQTRSKHSIVADRVVFLGSRDNVSEERDDSRTETTNQLNPHDPIEKGLMDQIANIKTKITAQQLSSDNKVAPAQLDKVPKKAKESTPDILFNDEPPFQDDLPF